MSDWIEWNGGECPVPDGVYVELLVYGVGSVFTRNASVAKWAMSRPTEIGEVVEYRIVKEEPEAIQGFNASGSKYLRSIQTIGGKVDVYAVLEAFAVTCPARQHAIKKLLCAGLRGKGDSVQDLKEAADAVASAVQMEEARVSTT